MLDLPGRTVVTLPGFHWVAGMLVNVPWPDPKAPFYAFRITEALPTMVIAYDTTDRNPVKWWLADDGWRVAVAEDAASGGGPHARLWKPVPITRYASPKHWWLDLDDTATGGCLVGMLPLHGSETGVYRHGRHWRVRCNGLYAGATLGEASARALINIDKCKLQETPCP